MPKSLFYQSSRLEACNFINTETLARVFFFEFWKIFKKSYIVEHLRTAASENGNMKSNNTVRNLQKIFVQKFMLNIYCGKKEYEVMLIFV